MRFFLSLILATAAAALPAEELRPATPDEVKLFKDAIKNTQQDTEHWAYTETTIKQIGISKKPEGETIVRFDPSKPWAEQYTPLKIEGKVPTEKQLRQYRERGEKRGKAIMQRAGQTAWTGAFEAGPFANVELALTRSVALGVHAEVNGVVAKIDGNATLLPVLSAWFGVRLSL